MDTQGYSINPPNPTDAQRHEILKKAFIKAGRPEDYKNVLRLLSPPAPIESCIVPGTCKGLRIGIIGAGLAGMAAAFELRKLGADITIFEASEDRVGGRVYTHYFDRDEKYFGEFGAIRIPVVHETTWYYINKFKLNTNPFIHSNPNAFIYAHDTRIRNDAEGRNIEEQLYPKYNLTQREKNASWRELYDFAINHAMESLNDEDRKEILKILPIYSPAYTRLINMSNRQIFEMLGFSQGFINLITSVDPLTGGILYFSYSETMQEMYPLNFEALYRINGGNARLPGAFYKSLLSSNPDEYGNILPEDIGRVEFKLGHNVNGIYRPGASEKVILKYRRRKTYEEELETFDYVVCAIPFTSLRTVDIEPLFTNRKMQAIRELNYLDALRVLLFCRKRFWEEDRDYGRINGGISYTDLPIQSLFYPSDHVLCSETSKCSPNEPGVLTVYNFNQDAIRLGGMSSERTLELAKRNIEEVHGLPQGYLDEIVIDHAILHWNNQEWFNGAVTMELPGQKRIFSSHMLKPEYDNRVFFAGEHISPTHAWMQGALYTGKLAANMLAMVLKQRKGC